MVTGLRTRLHVEPSETIASVKTSIRGKLGFLPENQVLQLLGSGLLEDAKTVADYYIRDNTDIALAVKTHKSMAIYVQTLTGATHNLEANPTTTIERFKAMLSHLTAVPCDEQILHFNGIWLQDGRTLNDYNISKGSMLKLFLRLKGD